MPSVWEASCVRCGEPLTVSFDGPHDDGDRVGIPCPTCEQPIVIAYQLRHRWERGKKRKRRIF